ncbi:Uncharacterised protein [Mycobacteroides abscessus subsp. abscessus]|nr:Uncharacterised protein [Mycobacteroides abscessus subsp. abscessus]
MGNASVLPSAESCSTRTAGTPRSENDWAGVVVEAVMSEAFRRAGGQSESTVVVADHPGRVSERGAAFSFAERNVMCRSPRGRAQSRGVLTTQGFR